jgi:phosphotransferase system  glucose/maltose/N-acetylglucosamine-specific IIC component
MKIERQYIRPVIQAIFRVFFYAAILFGISQLFYLDSVTLTETGKYGENSFTEWTQEIFLLLSSLLFFAIGRHDRGVTGFSGMLSGMALMALIREFNNYFHTWFSGAWQLLVLLALIATVIYVYRNRETLVKPFYEFLKLPAFGVSLSGFLIVMVYSRLFGRSRIWRNILEVEDLEGPTRWVKNAAEEGVELLGYALLFIATLEYCWHIYNRKKAGSQRTV